MKLNQVNRNNFQKNVKAFFRSKKWKNLLVFFVFVVLASCFWVLQYFRQKFDFEIAVSVNYTEIPSEIALSATLPQKIALNVQDRGTVWLQYTLGKPDLSVDIDLKDIRIDRPSFTIDKSTLYNLVSEKLAPSTLLKSFSPERIEINYSPLTQKVLPVIINGSLIPASGYMFSNSIAIEPAFVTVYGDNATLDTLSAVKTVRLDKKNIDKKMNFSSQLSIPAGTRLSVDMVKLTTDVEEYTEKSFTLPILCYNLPENRTVRFFPSTVELYVQVGLSKYPLLSEADFEIGSDYNDLIKHTSMSYSLTLTKNPQWLVNYRIVPEVVEFLVEQKRNP